MRRDTMGVSFNFTTVARNALVLDTYYISPIELEIYSLLTLNEKKRRFSFMK